MSKRTKKATVEKRTEVIDFDKIDPRKKYKIVMTFLETKHDGKQIERIEPYSNNKRISKKEVKVFAKEYAKANKLTIESVSLRKSTENKTLYTINPNK